MRKVLIVLFFLVAPSARAQIPDNLEGVKLGVDLESYLAKLASKSYFGLEGSINFDSKNAACAWREVSLRIRDQSAFAIKVWSHLGKVYRVKSYLSPLDLSSLSKKDLDEYISRATKKYGGKARYARTCSNLEKRIFHSYTFSQGARQITLQIRDYGTCKDKSPPSGYLFAIILSNKDHKALLRCAAANPNKPKLPLP